jgi:hypothetical protein
MKSSKTIFLSIFLTLATSFSSLKAFQIVNTDVRNPVNIVIAYGPSPNELAILSKSPLEPQQTISLDIIDYIKPDMEKKGATLIIQATRGAFAHTCFDVKLNEKPGRKFKDHLEKINEKKFKVEGPILFCEKQ